MSVCNMNTMTTELMWIAGTACWWLVWAAVFIVMGARVQSRDMSAALHACGGLLLTMAGLAGLVVLGGLILLTSV